MYHLFDILSHRFCGNVKLEEHNVLCGDKLVDNARALTN